MDRTEASETFVLPFYLHLIHGWKFEDGDPRGRELIDAMRRTAAIVTDHDAIALWATGWREAAMASWWASIHKWQDCEEHIGRVLSPTFPWYGYDGLLHFVALDLIGTHTAADVVAECLADPTAVTYDQAVIAAHSLHIEMFGYADELGAADMSNFDPINRQRMKRLTNLSFMVAN